MFINFPYTDAHQLNLDWILKELQDLKNNGVSISDILDIYNVKDFGAVGDGFTDDTDAFMAAIAAANGQPIYVPAGVYLTNIVTEITVPVTMIGSGTIKNFHYVNEHAEYNNYQNNPSWREEWFRAYGLTFENLLIRNQIGTSIILSAKICNCNFTGQTGLTLQNCAESTIDNCNFSQLQRGVVLEGSTNMLFTNCNFTAISGIAVDIGEYPANNTRHGGENVKFINCTFIDGVTAIKSFKSHWLWISNCLFDYFNNSISINGGIGFKITNSCISYEATDRSSHEGYIAPSHYAAVHIQGVVNDSFPAGGIIDNCEIIAYSTGTLPPVVADGISNYLIEELTITNCRFRDDGSNCTQLMTLNYSTDLVISGNMFYSPDNSSMDYCFRITNCMRVYCENNNWKKCYNGTVIYGPNKFTNSNQCVEYGELTLIGTGSSTTAPVSYTYEHDFTGSAFPKTIITIASSTYDSSNLIAFVGSQDFSRVFVQVKTLDGSTIPADATIKVDLIAIGSLNA